MENNIELHMTTKKDALDNFSVVRNALYAIRALREWIRAVPENTPLPAMPGIDSDWLDDFESALARDAIKEDAIGAEREALISKCASLEAALKQEALARENVTAMRNALQERLNEAEKLLLEIPRLVSINDDLRTKNAKLVDEQMRLVRQAERPRG